MRPVLRYLLILLFALQAVNLSAAKLYWVGGTGNFNDASHWSLTSGGRGGIKTPDANDDLYFDSRSSKTKFAVDIIGDASCHNLKIEETARTLILNGTSNEKFTVTGSVDVNGSLDNQFAGNFYFKSAVNSHLNLGVLVFKGDVYFDGIGEWTLNSNIVTTKSAIIYLIDGKLSSTNYSIFCGGLVSGNSSFELNLTGVYISSNGITSLGSNTILKGQDVTIDYDLSNSANSITNAPSSYKLGGLSTLTITPSNIDTCSCNGVCDGSATISWSGVGAGGPFLIRWTAGASTFTFTAGASPFNCTGLCANNWTVKVYDKNGFPAGAIAGASTIVNIIQPAVITLNTDETTPPTCFGNCDATQSINIIGGNKTYDVTVNPGPPTFYILESVEDTLRNLCIGWHTVSIVDRKGCSDLDSFLIVGPTAVAANPGNTNQLCSGVCNNKVWVAPTGGDPFATAQPNGIFYQTIWDGNPLLNNDTLYNLCPGTHTCVVTDSNACPKTVIITINPATPIAFTRVPASGAIAINCLNNCNGVASVTGVSGGSPGYGFSWLPPTGAASGTATSSTYSGLCGSVAGITYTCTISDLNSCTVTATFTVTAPPALTHPPITFTNPKCAAGQGLAVGSATVTESGGTPIYTYTWQPSGGNSSTASNLSGGSYTVHIKDNLGCLDSASTILTTPPAITGTMSPITNPTCPNLNDGQLCVTAGGGTPAYTYTWTSAPASGTLSCTAPNLTVPIGGSSTYQVLITDANSCTLTVTGTVSSPTPAVVTQSVTQVKCGSAPCTGSATLSVAGGGGGAFTYAWSCAAGNTTPILSGQCAGTSCNYTVTDQVTNCKYTGTVVFNAAPPVLNVSISATLLNCFGDCSSVITSTVSGGVLAYTYAWSGSNPIPCGSPTCTTQSSMCAGTYTLQITDANGCTNSANVTIAQPPALTITIVPTQPTCGGACDGSMLETQAGGSGSYATNVWSPSVAPPNATNSTLNPTNLCGLAAPGQTYTVTTTDSKGCIGTATATLINPSSMTVTVATGSITCNGLSNGTATASVAGGVSPYTFNWDGGGFTNSIDTSALAVGPHTLIVKDVNGCVSATIPFSIVAPAVITACVINQLNTCGPCTGSISASCSSGGTGPYSYTWTPADGNGNTVNATNLCVGPHTVTVGDANGCPTASTTFTITHIVSVNLAASSQSVSCNGGCDGLATATASGGTANYNMFWTSSPTNATVTTCPSTPNVCATPNTLCPGTYVIHVTDFVGCTNIDSVVIGNPPTMTVTATQTNIKCFGTCNGSATVTVGGGTPGYSINWSDIGIAPSPRSGLCAMPPATPLTYTVTDSRGCPVVQTLTITSNPQFTVTPTITSPTVCGGLGSIAVNATGGTAGYTFTWTPPLPGTSTVTTATPNSTLSGITANIYTVTITDFNGCDTVAQIALSDPGTQTVTITTQSVSCYGVKDGSTTINTVGAAPITITWPIGPIVGSNTLTVPNDSAGIYIVKTVDANGCIVFVNDTIKGPPQIFDHASITQPNCSTLGCITLAPTGGIGPPYTFVWDGVPGTNTICGLLPGSTHTCVVSDGTPCSQAFTYTMSNVNTPTITLTQTMPLCNAGVGSATVVPSGGTPTYTWTWTNSVGVFASGSGATTENNLAAGNYTVSVLDAGGCTVQQTFTITQPPVIVPNLISTNNLCNTGQGNPCSGTATVTPTGGTPGTTGYTFSWSPAAGGTASSTSSNSTFSNICPNIYVVTVKDSNNCQVTQTFTVTDPLPLTATITATNPNCNGQCTGTATVTPSGGTGTPATYTVSWGGIVCPNCPITPPLLCGGQQYTVTPIDSNGCSINLFYTPVDPSPFILATTSVKPKCPNDKNGSATTNTSGGTAPYTYTWTVAGGTQIDASPTSTYTNIGAGTYTVNITDTKGCRDSATINVVDPSASGLTYSTISPSCGVNDGSITITSLTGGTGTVSATWLGTACGTTSVVPTTCGSLFAGIYQIQLTDSLGCKDTVLVPLSNPNGPQIDSVVTNVKCSGALSGSIKDTVVSGINVGTPYVFTWTPAATPPGTITTGTNSSTFSSIGTGTYICTVVDVMGCQTSTTFTITSPTPIIDNGNSANATCLGVNNGTITSVGSGGTPGTTGYVYVLDGGVKTNTTGFFDSLSVGTHTVCISDSLGCSKCFNYNIGSNTAIVTITSFTNSTCSNSSNGAISLIVGGGVAPPYTIAWSNLQTGPTIINLGAGTYIATIKDSMGCQDIDTVKITAPTPIVPNVTVTSPTCGLTNGSLTVTPTGGTPGMSTAYTYTWTSPASNASGINNIGAGLYQVVIMDSLLCKQTFLIPVSNPGSPTVTTTATSPVCGNACSGVITTTVVSASPVTYLWLPGGQTTPSVNGLCPSPSVPNGIYFVEVKDAAGCIATVPDTITAGTTFTLNPTVTNPPCASNTGVITTTVTGGTGPYTYQWIPGGAVTSGIGPVAAGAYTVIVTDVPSGCVDTIPIGLNSLANGPTLTPNHTDALCNGICSGTASVNISGGLAPYNTSWSNGQNTVPINGLCPNNYFVTVTDFNGCVTTSSVTVSEPNILTSGFAVVSKLKCFNDCNGSISTNFSGGTPVLTYSWSPATIAGPGGNGLCAGNYSVTVTDGNGCTATEFDTLFNPTLLTITGTVTAASCNTVPDASINTTTNGGTGAGTYSYTWSGGSAATTSNVTGILVGNYSVTVTDANSCKDSASFVVNATVTVGAEAGNDTTLCSVPGFILNGDTTGATMMQWVQLPAGTVLGTTLTQSVVPVAGDTTQYVLIANNGTCVNRDTISIIMNTTPVPDAGTSAVVFVGQQTTLGGSPTNPGGSGTIVWHPKAGLSDSAAANPTVTPQTTTQYTVYVTNAAGCTGWDTITITVLPTFVVPNGFSPNGDGYNETWQIDYIYMFPNCEVEVYNRWGEQLFYSKGYNSPWNGKYNGKDLPVGTYYYVIRLNDKKFPDHFTGPLTILR
jgi:gliding motility-associated-like protein